MCVVANVFCNSLLLCHFLGFVVKAKNRHFTTGSCSFHFQWNKNVYVIIKSAHILCMLIILYLNILKRKREKTKYEKISKSTYKLKIVLSIFIFKSTWNEMSQQNHLQIEGIGRRCKDRTINGLCPSQFMFQAKLRSCNL